MHNLHETSEQSPQRRGFIPFENGLKSLQVDAEVEYGENLKSHRIEVGTLGILEASLGQFPTGDILIVDGLSYFVTSTGVIEIQRTKTLDAKNNFGALSFYLSSFAISDENAKKVGSLDLVVWVDGNEDLLRSRLIYDIKGNFICIDGFKKDDKEIGLYLEMNDDLLKKIRVGFEKAQETGGEVN